MSPVESIGAMINESFYNGTNPTLTQPSAGEQNEQSSADADRFTVNAAVDNMNKALQTLKREERQFNVDEDLGSLVVKIINADTKEIVRQIPTEEALSLSKRMQELVGLLYNK